MKRIIFSIVFILTFALGFAQKLSITGVDNSQYPSITVTVALSEATTLQSQDLVLYENGKEVPITLNQLAAGNTGSSICFLVEASGFTYGVAIDQFKKAVTDALNTMKDGNKFNVCYFGKANSDGKSLNVLSAEFTTDKSVLKNEINNKIVAPKDSNPVADVYKSIYECLDFMNSKKDLSGNKMLIVLSAAINNSKSPIKAEDCIEKSTKFTIPVYTITYKTSNKYAADNFIKLSDKTNGKSMLAKNSDEIRDAITSFTESNATTTVNNGQQYTLTFNATQNDETNNFEILYKGEKTQGNYTVPEGEVSFFAKYWWLFVGIGVLIIGVFVLLFLMRKKSKANESQKIKDLEEKNIALQQQMRNSNLQKTAVPETKEAPKFDLKKTRIGNSGGIPSVVVTAGNFSQTYTLSKPQMSIGRNPGNDITIPETTVSGSHAMIVNENGNWFVIDNNSTNGVFVNNTKVNKQLLNNNDSIKMGAALLKFQW